ncbi:MAG: hypothetical protein LUE97_06810 [Oscillospiraceae bacterium]|nr:hypothetical protein [Oscillospiraceae bacterium]
MTFTVDTTATSGFDLTSSVDYVTNWTTLSDEDSTTAIGKYTTLEAGTATMLTFSLLNPDAKNSADNPYLIDSVAKLELLRDNVNAGTTYEGVYFRQTVDLDLTSENWTPIGYNVDLTSANYKASTIYFGGVYDGNGCEVKLSIALSELSADTAASYSAIGLFGIMDGGTVKNLTVSGSVSYTDSRSLAKMTYIAMGGVAGDLRNGGSVENCDVKNMTISAESTASAYRFAPYMGGVVGYAYSADGTTSSKIANCSVESSVSVTGPGFNNSISNLNTNYYNSEGGIVGRAESCTISDCTNAAAVTGSANVGGIAGLVGYSSASSLENCSNTGDVTSSAETCGFAGGLIGHAKNVSTVTKCVNSGKVSRIDGGTYGIAGGLLGHVGTFEEISQCVNTGEVICSGEYTGTTGCGGLVGCYAYTIGSVTAKITDCYNIASVSGGSAVGGLIGNYITVSSRATITNCYNAGEVTSENDGVIGAVFGFTPSSTTFTNVYYLASACSEDTTGSTAVTWADMGTLAEKLGDSWVSLTSTNTVTFSFDGNYVSVTANGAAVEDAAVTVAVCPALSWETDTSANPAGVVFTLSASDNYGISAVTADGETLEADSDGIYALTVSENIEVTISVKRVSWGSDEAADSDIQSIIVSVAAATEEKSDENSTYDETLDLNGDDKNDLLDILSILYIRQAEDAAASDDSSSDDTASDTDTTTEETEDTTESTETTVEAAADTEAAAAEATETEEVIKAA